MIIQSRRVWVVDTWLEAQIEIEGEKIAAILPYGKKKADADYENLRLVPGFIDVHTHGAYGFDTNDADPDGLRSWTANIVSEGVTSFLPTTITQSEKVLTDALSNVAKVAEEGYDGAEILGIHFEGPYLDRKYKGAQPEPFCVPPDIGQFQRYLAASGNRIRIVTMACEHDEDFALTRFCAKKGIVVSQGHSGATIAEAKLAIANGARSMTHLHNGMPPYHHREPSLVGAAYTFPDVYGEIIADGNHVSPEVLHTFFEMKGMTHGIMITDSLRMKGLPPGTEGIFGGNRIFVAENGSAYLQGTQTLAGSTLCVNKGLKLLVEQALVPWQTAINACTQNPARMLRVDDRKGSIQAGKDADIVVLEEDYEIKEAFVRGTRRVLTKETSIREEAGKEKGKSEGIVGI